MTVKLRRRDAQALQIPLWDGLTAAGGLTHLAIKHIENAIAEVTIAQEYVGAMGKLTKAQAMALKRCWLALGDLRHMRPASSSRNLQRRADEDLQSAARVRDEEWQRRQGG